MPRGWVRFGLEVPARGRAQDIFGKWSVSFHGVKDLGTLRSILECGQLMKSGDVLPDGSVRVMVHTDPAPWAGEVIVESRGGWRGPYERITGDVMAYCTRCQEDPFMWQDRRGHWHALLHKMFDPPGGSAATPHPRQPDA